ncbi:hypothetical protein [Exiguobacterium sp. s6]|uniref:hypothetical protein n=1 Tax=Exiguobacterium sp. s6 TaxID=2751236 RepID=UPI001BEB341F|nr:hypothetical protein [Exiguobacterium sp. s6]
MDEPDTTVDPFERMKRVDLHDNKIQGESEPKNKHHRTLTLEPTVPINEILTTDPIMKVTLWIGSFGIYNESILTFYSNGFVKRELFILQTFGQEQRIESDWYNQADSAKVLKKFNSFKTHLWPELFVETETITHDGTQWKLEVCKMGEETRSYSGSNAYPPKWRSLKKLFGHY